MKNYDHLFKNFLETTDSFEFSYFVPEGGLNDLCDFSTKISFDTYSKNTKTLQKYNTYFNKAISSYNQINGDSNELNVRLLCLFLEENTIKNVFITKGDIKYVTVGDKIVPICPYKLSIILENNKSINVCFIEEFFDKRLEPFLFLLEQKLRETVKNEYLCNHDNINSIVISESDTMLDFSIARYNGISVGCFSNFNHNIEQFDFYVDFNLIIHEVIRNFYDENSELLDSIREKDDMTVINFTNNKAIIIKDKNFREKISPLIDNVIDDLIDTKVKKKGRSL